MKGLAVFLSSNHWTDVRGGAWWSYRFFLMVHKKLKGARFVPEKCASQKLLESGGDHVFDRCNPSFRLSFLDCNPKISATESFAAV